MEALRDDIEEITLVDPKESENTKPLEEVTPVSIHPDHIDRHVMIVIELTKELRGTLKKILKRNYDIFAWSQGNVPRIDYQVATHRLFTNPEYPSILQRRRKFAPERLKVIEEEVVTLIMANFIRKSHYPNWLANVVVAPKKGGSGEYELTSPTSTKRVQKIDFFCQRLTS